MEKMRIKPNLNRSDNPRQVGVCCQLFYCKEQRGFSLLEMMIVVIIIGVLTAIGMPAYSSWKQQQAVSNAASSLLAHLKQARSLAVAENRSVRITFSPTAYTFDADTTTPPASPCGPCRKNIIGYSQFSDKLSISPTTIRTFTSRGTANSGTMTLLASGNEKKITINVIGRAYQQ
jgi:prepilin-type N-terminal cleavage/methylation domain-containing protein